MNRPARIAAVIVASALLLAAGGVDSKPTHARASASPPTKIGKGEGQLDLIAWDGYVESGKNDPKADWVTPFEQQTGCKVTVKYEPTSDDMVAAMREGGGGAYDGVSASGDASNRLIAGGNVAVVNTKLIKGFSDINKKLQSPPHNTVNGKHYGVSFMWGANVLLYNTDVVKPAPTSWSVVFDPKSPYAGKLTAYDSPIYIADAAIYLKATKPSLKITDPYELTPKQLAAAVAVLKPMAKGIAKYWGLAGDEVDLFANGSVVAGQAWPYQGVALQRDGKPVRAIIPKEKVTGWADTWMMSSKAKHPNCMYKWMNWTLTPEVQAQVAAFVNYDPANPKACSILGQAVCDGLHVTDPKYFASISFWKTPLSNCGDKRGNACTDYSVWTQKWTEIKG